MIQPRISKLKTWDEHEKLVLEVVAKALMILKDTPDLKADEDSISRELFFCIREANAELRELGRGIPYPIVPQGQNPPHADDAVITPREKKRPDFYWAMIDPLEPNPRRSERQFVIECKRLGAPSPKSPKWIFNENYIMHGVLRFVTEEHGYAKGEKSALMIAYVQSMDFDVILQEVNNTITSNKNHKIPLLYPPSKGWKVKGLNCLSHILIRSFSSEKLSLLHFWVDLRI